jgi:alkanesulfonate monooxygenase SsuD/methylene tetrahydromethanopterin reductase-like flavin-dependent oxidoreductase (luciferase family)
MRFGLDFPNFGDFADVRFVAEIARTAEAAGWDGVFIWDHIARSSTSPPGLPTADVTVALTAIALATERVTFGPLVTPLARRRPQKVAREFTTLDHLSNGRVILGVGLGTPPEDEFAAFGEEPDARARAELLDESLEVITRLWSGERVDHDGVHHHVHSKAFVPSPVQEPRIPIWVAAKWPSPGAPIRRARRWDGIVPISAAPDASLRPDEIAEIRERIGRADIEIVVEASEHGTPADYTRAGATWWLEIVTDRDAALAAARRGPQNI